jgi:hypothetical protein
MRAYIRVNKKTTNTNSLIMKTLTLILLIFSGFACHVSASDVQTFNALIIEADGEKMDQIMTLWFDEFNNKQAQGENMITADLSAVKAVVGSFVKDNSF